MNPGMLHGHHLLVDIGRDGLICHAHRANCGNTLGCMLGCYLGGEKSRRIGRHCLTKQFPCRRLAPKNDSHFTRCNSNDLRTDASGTKACSVQTGASMQSVLLRGTRTLQYESRNDEKLGEEDESCLFPCKNKLWIQATLSNGRTCKTKMQGGKLIIVVCLRKTICA
jgi:hypothetical protein